MSSVLLKNYLKEEKMKRLIIVLVSLLAFSISAYAQMDEGMKPEQKGQMGHGMMGGEGKMSMMHMCQEMMKQKMGEEQMPMCPMCMQMMKGHKEMMKMMMDMMNMQERMMMGVKPSEKKQMMMDMAQMKEKMQKMMSMRMGMMGMDDSQARLKCAEGWLKKAIDLHELHMKDPKTTTEASQMELMNQIKKAYECITGKGSETSVAPLKETESKEPKKAEPSKADPHKH